MKKWICMLLGICLLLSGCGASSTEETNEEQSETLKVVATVFPAYDFARAAAGDKAEVSLLLPAGGGESLLRADPRGIFWRYRSVTCFCTWAENRMPGWRPSSLPLSRRARLCG